jgi:hypothetical protein
MWFESHRTHHNLSVKNPPPLPSRFRTAPAFAARPATPPNRILAIPASCIYHQAHSITVDAVRAAADVKSIHFSRLIRQKMNKYLDLCHNLAANGCPLAII